MHTNITLLYEFFAWHSSTRLCELLWEATQRSLGIKLLPFLFFLLLTSLSHSLLKKKVCLIPWYVLYVLVQGINVRLENEKLRLQEKNNLVSSDFVSLGFMGSICGCRQIHTFILLHLTVWLSLDDSNLNSVFLNYKLKLIYLDLDCLIKIDNHWYPDRPFVEMFWPMKHEHADTNNNLKK